MTEHHKARQPAFVLHGLKSEQSTKGFPCPGAGMHEHISSLGAGWITAAPQQLDQLLLPDSRSDAGLVRIGAESERRCCDGTDRKDESF